MSTKLANRLREARAKLGLSQTQASKAWLIPLDTLKKWEGNTRTPRGLALQLLLEKLDAILSAPPPSPPAKNAPAKRPRKPTA